MRSTPGSPQTDPDYVRGVELLRAGEWFAAHEAFEDAWRRAEAPERDFLQGLVHVAVAWYQAGRGKRIGCERQLEKALRRLGPYAPEHAGLDVDRAPGFGRGRSGTVPEPAGAAGRASGGLEAQEIQEPVHLDVQPPVTPEEEQQAEEDEEGAADRLKEPVAISQPP